MRSTFVKYAPWTLLLIIVVLASKGAYMYPHDPLAQTVGSIAGHEWQYNIWRTLGMADALADGMPGRWLSSYSHHWGYPLFEYTSPFPYTVSSVLLLLGFDAHSALNMVWLLTFAGAGVAMFWAMRPIFGIWSALAAATCYILAPYHLVDIFVRTNLVETSAFLFPPFVIRGLWEAQHDRLKGVLYGSIGIALLPLSHMLSTYLIGLSLIVFCGVYFLLLPLREKLPFAIGALLIATVGLGLSSFFWWPALADISAIKGMDAMTGGFYSYTKHFVYPHQLISSKFEYGASEPGPVDYMSFSLSLERVILAGAAVALAVFALLRGLLHRDTRNEPRAELAAKQQRARLVISAAITAGCASFLTLAISEPLWKLLPGIEAAQFPWRFLFPASFYLAICAGAVPVLAGQLSPKLRWLTPLLGGLIVLAILHLQWQAARAGSYGTVEPGEIAQLKSGELGVWTTNQLEFMPVGTEIPYKEARREATVTLYDSFFTPQPARVSLAEIENGRAKILLQPGAAGTLVIYQHWHPAWRASVDGAPLATRPFEQHPFAPIAVDLPEGAQELEVVFGYSASGRWGLWLSFLAFAAVITWAVSTRRGGLLRNAGVPLGYLCTLLVFYWLTGSPRTASKDDLFASVRTTIAAEDYANPVNMHSEWNATGNFIIPSSGVAVEFAEVQHNSHISLSLDSNDSFMLWLLNNDELVTSDFLHGRNVGGMFTYTLMFNKNTMDTGFDKLVLVPVAGDGAFSLGHIVAHSEHPVPEDHKRVQLSAGIPTVRAEDYELYKANRTEWDDPSNATMKETGLLVDFGKPVTGDRIDLSLDWNDFYLVGFVRGEEFVGFATARKAAGANLKGLARRNLAIPDNVKELGFDKVRIVPTWGDGYYSLGHIRIAGLRDAPAAPAQPLSEP
ncbi:6-pyruvoyl-tetrahydropterin synthase-related protein [Teredinibacter turnerae]|uniref:6-pyruvoyl-tetrahydropterin synthase-related protein n=1 Tax=Teredinibacter turnerae TaxID=2426 RepID=UPI00041CF50A|nr:6-pyruvoyl-tetrahydropterin synthase-related protein [Teredinibacter turnerae]